MKQEIDHDILVKFSDYFIKESIYKEDFIEVLKELKISKSRIPYKYKSNLDILKEIFKYIWVRIVLKTNQLIKLEQDPRDCLSEIFSYFFRIFLIEEPVLGKCIIIESHRYDKNKIKECFLIKKVSEFLKTIREYLDNRNKKGILMSINSDSLLELFLSIQDGMMFVWILNEDMNYSSKFTLEEFESISRLLVSSIFISPLDDSKSYYDYIANDYDNLYIDNISLAENKIVQNTLSKYLKKDYNILDLGCGSGLGYELITDFLKNKFRYTGIDISSQMINIAKNKFRGIENIGFYTMDMTNLSFFKKNYFNAVISLFGSFSHVIDNKKAVEEINRILIPGGVFILMLYSKYSPRNFINFFNNFSFKNFSEVHEYEIRKTSGSIFADARFYTKKTIKELLKDFINIKIIGLNCLLEIPLLKKYYLKKGRLNRAERLLYSESKYLRNSPFYHSLIVIGNKPI
ncbi:MAG: methyltransferase domain-containing protein [Candidatus Lokiarchaeota archaeon]|nr:methyltransferase domain-containing protein [Candidatus Lokiarchaeota archaeon]